MPTCPNCGADVSQLVPVRCRGCTEVAAWRRRAEAATLQAEKYRLDWQRLDNLLRHAERLRVTD